MKKVTILSLVVIAFTVVLSLIVNGKINIKRDYSNLSQLDYSNVKLDDEMTGEQANEIIDEVRHEMDSKDKEAVIYDEISSELPRHPKRLQKFPRTTIEKVESLIGNEEYVILDLNGRGNYEKSHIEGAINSPAKKLEFEAEGLIPNKDSTIITYHKEGKESLKGALVLEKLGYKNIINLGGENRWKNSKRLVKGE